MKRFAVVTLFPDAIDCWLQASVVGRARVEHLMCFMLIRETLPRTDIAQ